MHKAKSRRARTQPGDSYMELIHRLPLKKLRDDEDHTRAAAMVSELIGRDLDVGASDYLDALLVLVSKYEDEYHEPGSDLTPAEALLALMEFNGLSQADIGRIIGSESSVSMFLKGNRALSKAQIKKLADRFKIDASAFIS